MLKYYKHPLVMTICICSLISSIFSVIFYGEDENNEDNQKIVKYSEKQKVANSLIEDLVNLNYWSIANLSLREKIVDDILKNEVYHNEIIEALDKEINFEIDGNRRSKKMREPYETLKEILLTENVAHPRLLLGFYGIFEGLTNTYQGEITTTSLKLLNQYIPGLTALKAKNYKNVNNDSIAHLIQRMENARTLIEKLILQFKEAHQEFTKDYDESSITLETISKHLKKINDLYNEKIKGTERKEVIYIDFKKKN